MCDVDESLRVSILLDREPRQKLPFHPRLDCHFAPRLERLLRPGRLWKLLIPDMRTISLGISARSIAGGIWHSTYYTSPPWWKGPRVVTVPDMIHERFPNIFCKPEDEALRQRKVRCIKEADAVIAISDTTRNDLADFFGVGKDRVSVIPLACSDVFESSPSFASGLAPPTLRPYLLYVGVRVHYKGFGRLVNAFSRWRQRSEVDLVVVGKQWSPDEKNELERLGILDRVHLLQQVDDECLAELYRSAAAFVYPSLYEGFGIPLLEALACGCPVVASRIPSTQEVAGDCPIYFEPCQADDLTQALDRALMEGINSARCQAGLERVKQFSWDKTAWQTLEVYKAVCS